MNVFKNKLNQNSPKEIKDITNKEDNKEEGLNREIENLFEYNNNI
jgi:hypothetical protein